MNFLQDKEFLKQINQYHIRNYRAEIKALDFETEKVLAVLEGKVVSGNLSIAANSSVRRTGSLTLIADNDTMKISDINNIIAIDKKISISIGFDNPLYHLNQYRQYGEILWFKQGIFFITTASTSFSVSGTQVSLSFIDKMGKLNGQCGGIIPASASFHDRIEYDTEGHKKTTYPLIKDIIKECVNHFGEEHYTRIIVEDVDEVGRIQVNYNGDDPIRLSNQPTPSSNHGNANVGRSFVISQEPKDGFPNVYYKGDPIGYMETDLTYPGELTVNGGATVESVLNSIAKTLGNFEYFYDVDGNFHFRRIKDFQMTGLVPLNWNLDPNQERDLWQSYLPRYNNTTHIDEFINTSLVTQISYSPKYDNIKNDFVVWGTLNDNGNVNNNTAVRYHLAIDRRPKDIPKPTGNALYSIGDNYSLCHKQIYKITKADTKELLRYQVTDHVNSGEKAELLWDSLDHYNAQNAEKNFVRYGERKSTIPTFDWREELYRQALVAYGSSVRGSYYDEELLAEWRDIFDPTNEKFDEDWEKSRKKDDEPHWGGYNPNIKVAPHKIRYWLDIIDTPSSLGVFSVQRIGRRSQVTENSNVKSVFALEIPDLVFCINDGSNISERTAYYNNIGQDYTFITPEQTDIFKKINSYGTCYDEIRALMMNSLIYNSQVNLSCIPILYLDVNEIVHLNFSELGIVGDYVIKNIGWSLGGSGGTMSLTLNEANIII